MFADYEYFPVIVLFIVFILIAIRQLAIFRFRIWQIMLGGALAVLFTGNISFHDALFSINLDVMIFLFGMFVVGEALERSGYLYHIACRVFRNVKNTDHLVILILFVMGVFSAFLMNDTIAIIGTPLVLYFASRNNIAPKLLLFALVFGVTIGSAVSPIGNPQNLLIALNGAMVNPFATFFRHLFVPTVINLLLTYFILRFFYRDQFQKGPVRYSPEAVKDRELAFLAGISVILTVILVAVKLLTVSFDPGFDFKLTYIAVIAASPIVLFSKKRFQIARAIDWPTLVFFAAMFVLMESVWRSGFFQSVITGLDADAGTVPMILATSVVSSQFISNVPFVALYLPFLNHSGVSAEGMVALAAGSTIAGNLFILGAASNVIIIQNAEKRNTHLTFFEFAKVGVPVTAVNVLVYWLFLTI